MRKTVDLYPLGTFSAFRYIFCIVLSGYNSGTIQDIKFKFLAFLSLMKATRRVKIQSAGCTGFKVGIFRITPIQDLPLITCIPINKRVFADLDKKSSSFQ